MREFSAMMQEVRRRAPRQEVAAILAALKRQRRAALAYARRRGCDGDVRATTGRGVSAYYSVISPRLTHCSIQIVTSPNCQTYRGCVHQPFSYDSGTTNGDRSCELRVRRRSPRFPSPSSQPVQWWLLGLLHRPTQLQPRLVR
jgi:hypothetical protein